MEAARRAAYSGHELILCEQKAQLGGQLKLAEQIPGRHEIGDIVPWFEGQLAKLGVDVRLNTTIDKAYLESLNPDAIIVATGSLPKVPENLMSSIYNIENIVLVMADDLIDEKADTGNNILILGGDPDWYAIGGLSFGKRQKGYRG